MERTSFKGFSFVNSVADEEDGEVKDNGWLLTGGPGDRPGAGSLSMIGPCANTVDEVVTRAVVWPTRASTEHK